MLVVNLTPRRKKFVQLTEDNGGFYCQVFEDEDGKAQCEDFYIDRKSFLPNSTPEERRKKAMQLADYRVRNMFK